MRQRRLALGSPGLGIKANAALEELAVSVDEADESYWGVEQTGRKS